MASVFAVAAPDPLRAIVDDIVVVPESTVVLAVAGPVAVGKSTIAGSLADHLRSAGARVAVLSTDGFLYPNAVLEARGLVAIKGHPETYDLDRIAEVLDLARQGRSPLAVPVYAHDRYDVLPDPERIERPDVLVLEGVVALQRPFADLGVYVDAEEEDIVAWYSARFLELVREAADDPWSFYRPWVDLDDPAVIDLARAVWDSVNHPNLVHHIAPTRAAADVVVLKGTDHGILSVQRADP